ncbi:nicotinate-nucleotide--dimethylbenzimidazole phosphoribosyltransferase [Paenibacillus sp. CGMCC 1.16610]|uniref:Nicotinate-nucleotide--dimethylbenzimidazole phosphoribosyltransferase n=1 Tax=Paenibacillus anseongense TaxID=2682845 RepID=A0ABW9U657_9BACL|nr:MULTISPECIES: nicotinate-nucleotide--dimethylbenzimidazole phosphoribosyltransferase [Paenibacillus]MBA2940405.1 nicotinate-nucleotide--dimethylbenzimidazole phosphoribosyltransferase [Paenibacillus sp. CGMCC 1.16610]MVQ35582.1 nicotinate-nucleotide--dimethylbenzimidazole phosphoribosyltransferase [Paenibacillus anseongense]
MSKLQTMIGAIEPIHADMVDQANNHLNQLTKPQGSLGKLEDIARQVAGITGEVKPLFDKKAVIVMAGDHGVCEEGISAFPAEVTPQMVLNFLHGGAAVNVLARHAGADVVCVDMGVNADLEHPNLVSRKVRKGSRNMAREAALTLEETVQAIEAGIELVDGLAQQGYRLFATGEMGIGNTTASAAILCALGGVDAEISVGRGTGIDDAKWLHKRSVVNKALDVNGLRPAKDNAISTSGDFALEVLSKVGGLEIAGLVGVILGAAKNRCPVVVDGYISSAAALVAIRLAPLSASYMLASHLSQEQGHAKMLEAVGLSAMLQMDMRLGEGTGAVLAFNLIEAAGKIMREMATFESAGVSRE